MPTATDNGTASYTPTPDKEPFDGSLSEAEWNLNEAVRLNDEVNKRRIAWEAAKEEAAERKKFMESAQDELSSFLSRVREEMPLFDKKE